MPVLCCQTHSMIHEKAMRPAENLHMIRGCILHEVAASGGRSCRVEFPTRSRTTPSPTPRPGGGAGPCRFWRRRGEYSSFLVPGARAEGPRPVRRLDLHLSQAQFTSSSKQRIPTTDNERNPLPVVGRSNATQAFARISSGARSRLPIGDEASSSPIGIRRYSGLRPARRHERRLFNIHEPLDRRAFVALAGAEQLAGVAVAGAQLRGAHLLDEGAPVHHRATPEASRSARGGATADSAVTHW